METYTIRDDVGVTVERSFWVSVRALIAGQVPDDQSLVARTGEEHIWVLERSRERGDPSGVALKGALKNELFRHLEVVCRCSIGLRQENEVLRYLDISPHQCGSSLIS
jgi:hypothetical protein